MDQRSSEHGQTHADEAVQCAVVPKLGLHTSPPFTDIVAALRVILLLARQHWR